MYAEEIDRQTGMMGREIEERAKERGRDRELHIVTNVQDYDDAGSRLTPCKLRCRGNGGHNEFREDSDNDIDTAERGIGDRQSR